MKGKERRTEKVTWREEKMMVEKKGEGEYKRWCCKSFLLGTLREKDLKKEEETRVKQTSMKRS